MTQNHEIRVRGFEKDEKHKENMSFSVVKALTSKVVHSMAQAISGDEFLLCTDDGIIVVVSEFKAALETASL